MGIVIDRNTGGKGYGTAALRILLDCALNERKLHKDNTVVLAGNTKSETMIKKPVARAKALSVKRLIIGIAT